MNYYLSVFIIIHRSLPPPKSLSEKPCKLFFVLPRLELYLSFLSFFSPLSSVYSLYCIASSSLILFLGLAFSMIDYSFSKSFIALKNSSILASVRFYSVLLLEDCIKRVKVHSRWALTLSKRKCLKAYVAY